MGIEYKVGNLLDAQDCIIVHGCNNQGIMGAGVALAIKNKFPWAYDDYAQCYNQDRLSELDTMEMTNTPKLGDVIWASRPGMGYKVIIANAITQEGFGQQRDTCYSAVDDAIKQVFKVAVNIEMNRVCMPLIGSGIGGGNWAVIEKIIEQQLVAINAEYPHDNVNVIVYCLTEQDVPAWVR